MCEYDEDRLIKAYLKEPNEIYSSEICTYEYDDTGTLASKVWFSEYESGGGEKETYLYDETGRLIESEWKSWFSVWSESDPEAISIRRYDYQYGPFALVHVNVMDTGFAPSYISLSGLPVDDLVTFSVDRDVYINEKNIIVDYEEPTYEMEDGYLKKVSGEVTVENYYSSYSYEFFYDGEVPLEPEPDENQAVYAAYIPAIETALDETEVGTGSGFLCDLDGDGIEEMLLLTLYTSIGQNQVPGYAFSVYDVENGVTVTKLDKEPLYYEVGGPSGEVSAADYLGEKVIVAWRSNSADGNPDHQLKDYTIYDAKTGDVVVTASLDYYWGNPIQVESCSVNGKACNYNEYLEVVDEIDVIVTADTWENNDSDGSMTLEELLTHVQTLCEG